MPVRKPPAKNKTATHLVFFPCEIPQLRLDAALAIIGGGGAQQLRQVIHKLLPSLRKVNELAVDETGIFFRNLITTPVAKDKVTEGRPVIDLIIHACGKCIACDRTPYIATLNLKGKTSSLSVVRTWPD